MIKRVYKSQTCISRTIFKYYTRNVNKL